MIGRARIPLLVGGLALFAGLGSGLFIRAASPVHGASPWGGPVLVEVVSTLYGTDQQNGSGGDSLTGATSDTDEHAIASLASSKCSQTWEYDCGPGGNAKHAVVVQPECELECEHVGYLVRVKLCEPSEEVGIVWVTDEEGGFSGGALTPIGDCAPGEYQFSDCPTNYGTPGIEQPPPPESFMVMFPDTEKIESVEVMLYCCNTLICIPGLGAQ